MLKGFFTTEAFGYASIRAWSLLLFANLERFSPIESPAVNASVRDTFFAIAIVAMIAIAIFCHVKERRFEKMRKALYPASIVVMEAGTLVVMCGERIPVDSPATLGLGAVLSGIGFAGTTVLWGEAFSKLPLNSIVKSTASAFICANILSLAALSLSEPMFFAMTLLLPILSSALYSETSTKTHEGIETRRITKENARPLLLSGAYVLLVSIVSGSMYYLSHFENSLNFSETSLAASLAFSLYVAIAIKTSGRLSASGALHANTYFAAFALMILTISSYLGNQEIALFLSDIVWTVFYASAWTHLATISSKNSFHPIMIAGTGMSVFYLGKMLGSDIADIMEINYRSNSTESYLVYCVILMFLLTAASFLGTKSVEEKPSIAPNTKSTPCATTFESRIEEVAHFYSLTDREKDVLRCLAKGYPSKAIQEELSISASTVSVHSGSIYRKLGIHSKAALMKMVSEWNRA